MAGYLHTLAFIQNIGGPEWMVILVIALLVFGRRLPEVARSLGRSVNEFKKGLNDFQNSANEVANDVNKATNEALSDGDTDNSQTTYEGSSGSYESQTTTEPTSEVDAGQATTESTVEVGTSEPAAPVGGDSDPVKPNQPMPTDTFAEPMS